MTSEKEKLIKRSFNRSKGIAHLQAELKTLAEGYIEIKIPKLDFMARPAGMFNGAAISSLVDVTSGYAAVSARKEDAYFSTVEMKINFLNPAMGDYLLGKGKVVKSGKRLVVVQVDVFGLKNKFPENEHLVATSLVTMMQLK